MQVSPSVNKYESTWLICSKMQQNHNACFRTVFTIIIAKNKAKYHPIF